MRSAIVAVASVKPALPRRVSRLERLNDNRNLLGFLFMLPAAGILLIFLTYPLGLGLWLGLTDTTIGQPGPTVSSATILVFS